MIVALTLLAVGDSWVSEIKTKFTIPEDGFTLEYDFLQTATVVSVGEKLVVRLDKIATANRLDGANIPMAKDAKPFSWESKIYGGYHWNHGAALSDVAEISLQRLIDLPLEPPKQLERVISFEQPPKSKMTLTYDKIGEIQKRSAMHFSVVYRDEDGMKATGEGWAEMETGIVLDFSLKATNAPIPGGEQVATFTVGLKVVKLYLQK